MARYLCSTLIEPLYNQRDLLWLEIDTVEPLATGEVAKPPRYALIESAGLFVTLDEAAHEGDKLRLKGKRTA